MKYPDMPLNAGGSFPLRRAVVRAAVARIPVIGTPDYEKATEEVEAAYALWLVSAQAEREELKHNPCITTWLC